MYQKQGGIFTRACCIGAGNVGLRHIKNLVSLGHDVSIVETDVTKREQLSLDYDVYGSIKEAFSKDSFDIAIIASPTSLHIPQTQEIAAMYDVRGILIEKPIGCDSYGVNTLVNICKEKDIKLMVSENLRFNNGIELIKLLLDNRTIGKLYYCKYFFGQDLKKWHLDIDYTKSYSAGICGGAARDDVHAVALMLHFFGDVIDVKGYTSSNGTLNIECEDCVDYLLKHKNGVISHIHSDYLCSDRTRDIELYGTDGVIQWSFADGTVNLKTPMIESWRTFSVKEDINEMYIKMLNYFIGCVEKNIEPYHNGITAMQIVDKIRKQNSDI